MANNIFTTNITHNDIYIFANFGGFEADPNMPLSEFRDSIISNAIYKARRYYDLHEGFNVDVYILNIIGELCDIFDSIVSDAITAGTWMNFDQLYNTETYRVVNFANAVRNR